MPEELHVLVKTLDEIDTTRTGHKLPEMPFVDIIIQIANLTEEAINSSLGFLVFLLYPGPESLLRQSHEGFIHDLMESNPASETSAITQDSTHRSLKRASWKRLSIMDNRMQAVWNTPIPSTIFFNLSLCFHWDSVTFA